jgi:anaerobic selenocysteine-containing dehydrogenase
MSASTRPEGLTEQSETERHGAVATERSIKGTCHHDCPDTCGWVVTVEDGVAVKLRGNPEHPYSKGELCPKVNRMLDRVYSPDRILTPLVRVGPKGSGQFEPASWDDALALVASRLHAVIEQYGGEAVLPYGSAGTQGLLQMSSLDQRFFAKVGSTRQTGSICGATAGAGVASTYGTSKAADATNVRHSKFVILWGTNTKVTNRHLWPFIEEARANGAPIVVIDPIRTATAEDADWFIQPLPGTDVALMLAMMHILIRDRLLDDDYVSQHTVGIEELTAHVADWTPDRAAEICGLTVDEIEQLGHAYGTAQPAMIRTLIGAEHHEHGAMFFRTLACLPALTGSWRHRGGGLARSVGSWSDVNVDDSVFAAPHLAGGKERRGLNAVHLSRSLTDPAVGVNALFVWNCNPLVTVPNAQLIRKGLEREDLLCVVSEHFMTDTAMYADVIFPATTQIEQTDVVTAWGHLYVGYNHAAIAPLGESVPNTELWRRLARAMGYTEPELFESDESLMQSAMKNVDIDRLKSDAFIRLDLPEDFRPYANGGFATSSGKAELWSAANAPAYLPANEGPGGDSALVARFPLVLLTPKQHHRFLNTSYSHLPKHGPLEGAPFLELDPADAAARGIANGDQVVVRNDRGSLGLEARVSGRLRPGVVAVPFGWWADQHGERATANALTSDTGTDWGGGVAYSDTLVEVVLAT